MSSWLRFDPSNNVIICHNNCQKAGLSPSLPPSLPPSLSPELFGNKKILKNNPGLLAACLLRFLNKYDSSLEAWDYLSSKPLFENYQLSAAEKRYLKYFDSLIALKGHIPNQKKLVLHKVIMNDPPAILTGRFDSNEGDHEKPHEESGNFFPPVLQIINNGKVVFSSSIKMYSSSAFSQSLSFPSSITPFLFHRAETKVAGFPLESAILLDQHHIIFNCGCISNLLVHAPFHLSFIYLFLLPFQRYIFGGRCHP